MIQRIQTVWLLFAALLSIILFFVPIFKAGENVQKIGTDYLAVLLNALSIVLSLWAIISFKKRKTQKQLSLFNVLLNIGLLIWIFKIVQHFEDLQLTNYQMTGYFWIGAFLPIIVCVCLFMAIAGIRKDEKLLKSLDRLR